MVNQRIDAKVLVISHNVFSTTSSMGKTMASFFEGWDKENIAQLYFHSESPNSNICKNYFRITDFNLIESFFKFNQPGEIINESEINLNTSSTRIDTGIKSNIYNLGKKRKPYMYLLRNLLWGSKKWKSDRLIRWLDDFNPDIVFYAAGDYSFSIKVALDICELKKIPMIVFFGDDYYFLEAQKGSIIDSINRKMFKGDFLNMFSYLSSFIAASDKMQKKYYCEFNRPGYAIMTSAYVNEKVEEKNNIKISYIGNMGFERWKPLIEIGKSLKEIGYEIDVYSGEKSEDIICHLKPENGIRFHGSVPSYQVKDIIKSSTILIHVESMDEVNKEKTRYSMSTKIAESLGSGVCLFAYGPKDVSSIEYLIDNDAACVVTDSETLKIKLNEILLSKELREKYINNAQNLARKRHNYEINLELFHEIVTRAWKSKEGNINENTTN